MHDWKAPLQSLHDDIDIDLQFLTASHPEAASTITGKQTVNS